MSEQIADPSSQPAPIPDDATRNTIANARDKAADARDAAADMRDLASGALTGLVEAAGTRGNNQDRRGLVQDERGTAQDKRGEIADQKKNPTNEEKIAATTLRNIAADLGLAQAMSNEPHAPENGPATEAIRLSNAKTIDNDIERAQESFDRWARIIGWCFAVGIIFSIIYMATAVRYIGNRVPEPSYVYDNDVYQPVRSVLCPGEALTYVLTTTVKSAPSQIEVSYSVRNMDTFRNAISGPVTPPNGGPIFIPADVGRTITATIVITENVLGGLPAGHYEYRRIAKDGFSSAQFHSVPFTILSCAQPD